MKSLSKRAEAAPTVLSPNFARLVNEALTQYPLCGIISTCVAEAQGGAHA